MVISLDWHISLDATFHVFTLVCCTIAPKLQHILVEVVQVVWLLFPANFNLINCDKFKTKMGFNQTALLVASVQKFTMLSLFVEPNMSYRSMLWSKLLILYWFYIIHFNYTIKSVNVLVQVVATFFGSLLDKFFGFVSKDIVLTIFRRMVITRMGYRLRVRVENWWVIYTTRTPF